MLKPLLLAALLALASTPASAQAFLAFGVGGDPCDDWISARDTNEDVGGWILGFWSGMNLNDQATVGHESHGTILAEAKAACHLTPEAPIAIIVQTLYMRYKSEGR
jgi:hypothetical protein